MRLSKAGQWVRLCIRRVFGSDDGSILATSMDLCDDPLVVQVLGQKPGFHSRLIAPKAEQFVGWGRKWSGRRAADLSRQHGVACLLLEDGFLRSVDRRDPAMSVVMDDTGVHYDASGPSRLEGLIDEPLSHAEQERVRNVMQRWRDAGVSKYNSAPDYAHALPDKYVLVIDQVRGDLSVRFGNADQDSFEAMLKSALADNPDAQVIVKLHPDVFTDRAKSHFDPNRLRDMDRVQVVADGCHPARLIAQAQSVYVVTSQVGFEALIWGKQVHCFGMPFYAGWGLTKDALPAPGRRGATTIEQLVHGALIRYARYVDPVTKAPFEVEDAIDHVALQRRHRLDLPKPITAVGFSYWKCRFLPPFLAGADVRFSHIARADAPVAVWGRAEPPEGANDVLRIEDGFLRSAGLGADLVRPMSIVIDRTGIYYDATRPSDLENTLNTQDLSPSQLSRAEVLRGDIVAMGMTKYNVGGVDWSPPDRSGNVILVVGQVETDASLAFGSPAVKTNLALLKHVRATHPQDYIVFKPHPDVLAGLRDLSVEDIPFAAHCDEVLTVDVMPDTLFSRIDALHTMTSLMGFEALLRGIPVTCHGLPFYAGWGLTIDTLTCPRRQSVLSLDALVYGALISYPRYVDYNAKCFVSPEQALDLLGKSRGDNPSWSTWYRKFQRLLIIFVLKLRGTKK